MMYGPGLDNRSTLREASERRESARARNHPHHEAATPKFCKRYGAAGQHIVGAIQEYVGEVRGKHFPSPLYSPYRMPDDEEVELSGRLADEGLLECSEAVHAARAWASLEKEAAPPQ